MGKLETGKCFSGKLRLSVFRWEKTANLIDKTPAGIIVAVPENSIFIRLSQKCGSPHVVRAH